MLVTTALSNAVFPLYEQLCLMDSQRGVIFRLQPPCLSTTTTRASESYSSPRSTIDSSPPQHNKLARTLWPPGDPSMAEPTVSYCYYLFYRYYDTTTYYSLIDRSHSSYHLSSKLTTVLVASKAWSSQ